MPRISPQVFVCPQSSCPLQTRGIGQRPLLCWDFPSTNMPEWLYQDLDRPRDVLSVGLWHIMWRTLSAFDSGDNPDLCTMKWMPEQPQSKIMSSAVVLWLACVMALLVISLQIIFCWDTSPVQPFLTNNRPSFSQTFYVYVARSPNLHPPSTHGLCEPPRSEGVTVYTARDTLFASLEETLLFCPTYH